jgi:FlaA1/EpsC-like NDP-sugar epimerase
MSHSMLRGLFKFDLFRTLLVCADVLIMTVAMGLAYVLVFEGAIPAPFLGQLPFFLGMALATTLSTFAAVGVYSRRLPHLSENEVRWIVLAATLAEVICYTSEKLFTSELWAYLIAFWTFAFVIRGLIGIYASYRSLIFPLWQLFSVPLLAGLAGAALLRIQMPQLTVPESTLPVSRTIHALYFFISTTGFILGRWALHWIFVYYKSPHRGRKRAILLGDGLELSFFTRLNEMSRSYHVVAVLDNDPLQWGMRIQNVRVLGGINLLPQVAQQMDASTVLLLKDSLSQTERNTVDLLCRENHLNLVRLGSLQESLLRSDSLSTADLLERQEYRFLPSEQDNYLKGKRVLVTGAGGSIGSELVRQILRCEPAQVILLGRGENSIFELEQELKSQGCGHLVSPVIVNITDADGLARCYTQYTPQVIFHAAAHKHVPLMENNVHEAVRNNVLGTWNVMDLAGKHQVERVVMISTDKAVAPASVMGATKRKAEQVVASCAELYNNTRYTVVRFGNVLGSRGSVVRIFLDQIRKGGPVTVTDPRMTRFFMTIPEAVSLVLASGSLGNGFGVYVLEMGKPYRIVELAEKMIRLCGLEPGTDIKIEFSGVRPGEKLEEVLVTGEEKLEATSNAQIRRLAGNLAGPRWNVPDLKTKLGTEDAKLREWLLENAY